MADEEDYSQFDVNISGKEYRTVAGRLKEFLDKKEKNKWQVFKFPEWLILGDNPVCRYHICVLDKDGKFLWYSAGTAGAYDKTMIDKSNPYENAETSAMGRALASEGYGLLSSIASAEEVTDAKERQVTTTSNNPPTRKIINDNQLKLLNVWFGKTHVSDEWKENLKTRNKINHFSELSTKQMNQIKDSLIKAGILASREEVDEEGKKYTVFYNPKDEESLEEQRDALNNFEGEYGEVSDL